MHLAGHLLHPFLTCAVDFLQVFHELAGEQKLREQHRTMFFEVAKAHPPVLTQRALFCFGQAKVGKQVVSVLVVGELHGKILAFCCIEKAAMVLKVSLRTITA